MNRVPIEFFIVEYHLAGVGNESLISPEINLLALPNLIVVIATLNLGSHPIDLVVFLEEMKQKEV